MSSFHRHLMTIRKTQPGTIGGQSRAATPVNPKPLLFSASSSPTPSDAVVAPVEDCIIAIHASETGNTYASPRGAVALDEAGMSNPCALNASIQVPNTVPATLLIPPGNYSGITAHVEWGDATTAEVFITVEDEFTFLDQDLQSGVSSGVDLSIGLFTITGDFGRVTLNVDFFPDVALHTIDPVTIITITKTA